MEFGMAHSSRFQHNNTCNLINPLDAGQGGRVTGLTPTAYCQPPAVVGWRVAREWRRREKNLLARIISVAICARNSSGLLNFFSSRRRFQNRTSIRFGAVARWVSSKCVSMLSEEPLNVGRIPIFVTERWLRVSPSRHERVM